MAEVDTSSFPKPPALPVQKSLLDNVQQYQQLESQNLTISKQKLDQINTQFGLMNQELSGLADGNPSKEEAAHRLTTFAKTYGFKPEVTNHMLEELNAAPNVKSFAEKALIRGQTTQERLNQIYGQPTITDNGQTLAPGATSQMRGVRPATGLPVQKQVPVDANVIGTDNRPTMQGPTPAVTPPGTVAVPTPLPVSRPQGTFAPPPGTLLPTTGNQAVQVRNPYPAPSGPAVGQTPLFEEGRKAYTADQENAVQKMTAIQPAVQALNLMKTPGFNSGPGTEGFNRVVAALKTWGIVDTAGENDPTAAYQQITKKLADYLSRSPVGQRSDAAQTLKEASSPNPKVQILPALVELTKDAIALDRMEAARPGAFKGKDFEKYQEHRSVYPQSMDYRAFKLDQMGDDGPKLVQEMKKRLDKNKDDKQAIKFFNSLELAQKYYQ